MLGGIIMTTPYMPSSGMEGLIFYDRWCGLCQKDAKYRETQDGEDGCPILAKATGLGEQPEDWLMDDNGATECTAFIAEVP